MTNPATTPRNTILHGDCLTILPQLAAGSVDFILTDPPYLARYKSRDGRTVPNDDNDTWLQPSFAEMFRVLRRDSFCVSFYGWPHADRFIRAFRTSGFRVVGHFVFPKRYTSSEKYLRYQHECAYTRITAQIVEHAELACRSFFLRPFLLGLSFVSWFASYPQGLVCVK